MGKEMKVIVCVSDLQIPYHHGGAVDALANFIKRYKPDEVVSVGDEMDMQTISRWAKGTPLEYEGSIAKDRDLTTRTLERLKVDHMIRSNHTDRLYNTVMLRSPGLLGLPELTLPNFLRLNDIGVEYHTKPYELAPGWLLFHGDEGNVQPTSGATALGLAKRSGMSVVCGHTHRMGLTHFTQSYYGSKPRTVWGMEVGCMMDFKYAKYVKGGLFTWQLGFGVLFVDGQKVTPSIIPMNLDGSFVFEGKLWK
jgi:hypothetical protein